MQLLTFLALTSTIGLLISCSEDKEPKKDKVNWVDCARDGLSLVDGQCSDDSGEGFNRIQGAWSTVKVTAPVGDGSWSPYWIDLNLKENHKFEQNIIVEKEDGVRVTRYEGFFAIDGRKILFHQTHSSCGERLTFLDTGLTFSDEYDEIELYEMRKVESSTLPDDYVLGCIIDGKFVASSMKSIDS